MNREFFIDALTGLIFSVILFGLATSAQSQCFPEASCRVTEPADVQVVVAGDVISARDSCGTLKEISSIAAVTTSLVNTFTPGPQLVYAGCWMFVCNVGLNNITLDNNANFVSGDGSDVVATPNDCLTVVYDGVKWLQATSVVPAPAVGGGTPGGADGDIQYNNGGAFGGFGDFNDGTNATTLPGSLTIGVSGNTVTRFLHNGAGTALDFGNAGATLCSDDLTVAVTNAALSDVCTVGVPHVSVNLGSIYTCWVSAAGTVTVRHCNMTASGNDPTTGTFKVLVVQQ